MAGPGFQLGSFSTGLFSGAQNIFSLYKEYQGVRQQSLLDDYAREVREQQKRDAAAKGGNVHPVEGTQDFTKAPGQTAPTQTPSSTPTVAPGAPDERRPITPSDSASSEPDYSRSITPNAPSDSAASAPTYGIQSPAQPTWDPRYTQPGAASDVTAHGEETPSPPALNPRTGLLSMSPPRPASPGMTGRGGGGGQPPAPATSYTDPNDPGYRYPGSPVSPGVQSDVDAHGQVQFAPRQPPAWPMTPTNAPVGATLGLGGSSAIPNQSAISNQPVGASLQGQPTPTRTAPVNQPIPSAQIGGPYTPPSQQDPRPPQQQGPTAPIPPPTMVGGGPEQGPPTEREQGNRPYIPPPQRDPRDLSSPAIGGPAVQGGVPLAAAEPPSLGQRILRSLNPMGSAQAAEVAPGGQGATGITPARPPGENPNAPVSFPPPTQPAPVAPAPPATAQPSGITPAQPPAQGAPAHPPAGPVVVAGTGGTVSQSQATPPLLAPNVDYGALRRAEKAHPDKLALAQRAIQVEGADGLSLPFVAATIERESKWQSGLTHGTGKNGVVTDAKGLMQVIGDTRDLIDPRHELNPLDDFDSLRLGVRYYKYLATHHGLDYNTVQSAFAYRAGPGRLKDVAAMGWDGYAASSVERADQVENMKTMFPGTVLTTALVPGGTAAHGPYDAKALYMAEQKGGPDGFLSALQETGPAGIGDTGRWRAAQSALEQYLIINGHPDKAGMAQEWVAQISQQGAVSHLLAADQALLANDKQDAINHILKSYAFYPDGAYARAGTDKSGNIWAYKLKDGGDGTPHGEPLQITHELIAQKLIQLQHPQTYLKELREHQKANADLDLKKAQADWARARPEIAALQTESREAIANAKMEAARQLAAQRAADKEASDKERGIRIAEHNTHLEEEANKLYPADADLGADTSKFTAEEYPVAANIYRQLRKHPEAGGANLSSVDAYRLANGLAAGVSKGSKNPAYRLDLFGGEDGKPKGYGVVDKSGKVLKTLTLEQGELVKGIVGLAGSAPLQPPGTTPAAPAPTPGITPARPPAPSNTSAPGANMDPAFIPMTGLTRRPLTMAA